MRYYKFDSWIVDKHITRDRMTHCFWSKKDAQQARKDKIREGRVCGEITMFVE